MTEASDRFEHRLGEECEKLSGRFERGLGEECGRLRTEISDLKHELKLEIANTKTDLIKWSFVFWVGQFLGVAGLLATFVR